MTRKFVLIASAAGVALLIAAGISTAVHVDRQAAVNHPTALAGESEQVTPSATPSERPNSADTTDRARERSADEARDRIASKPDLIASTSSTAVTSPSSTE